MILRNMKRPLSPDYILENGIMSTATFLRGFEENCQRNDRPEFPLSMERKKMLFSLCEACNIQLNSAAQAQIHYNGKSHLKRVKQLNNGKAPPGPAPAPGSLLVSASTGSTCLSTTLPALVRTSTMMMQPSLDIKPFMPYSVENSSAAGLFPNFNTMDPVQKAVINHTFGVSIPPRKKQVISCNVCQLRFNSDSQAEAHYKGSKHTKKLKALETTKSKQKTVSPKDSTKAIPSSPPPITANNKPDDDGMMKINGSSQPVKDEALPLIAKPEDTLPIVPLEAPSNSTNGAASIVSESEEEKAKKLLYCSLCKVAVNSLSQLEAHNIGSKHKTMVEARNGAGPIKSYPRSGSRLKLQNGSKGSGLQNKTFHCEICDVHVNSEIQLKQHISSRRHKDRVAGKPMKPKYSPYNKLQRGPSVLASKLLQARTDAKYPVQGPCPVLFYADETVIMQGTDVGLQHQLVKLGDFLSENELKAKFAFQKDMMKPMAPAFLSSSLAAAVSSTLSLPPRPSTSLFPASAIPSPFLRPGHGPIRATTASILFAPY